MGNVQGMVTAAGGGGMGGGGMGGGGMGGGVTGGSNLSNVVGGRVGAMGGGVCGAGNNMCAPSRRTRLAPFCARCPSLPLHTRRAALASRNSMGAMGTPQQRALMQMMQMQMGGGAMGGGAMGGMGGPMGSAADPRQRLGAGRGAGGVGDPRFQQGR